ncbi:MAG TPA: XRE family transcriptional regulator [Candidatus Sulfotelmatobacter sp.]|nr:XRE family transcriptional regulator [Candidatus Sulfotelmatobacter sp.]
MASSMAGLKSQKQIEPEIRNNGHDIIAESLRPFSIGEKLRTLRLRKKLGLVELGKHTGFSAALLSKLERGRLYPTLPTLVRIAAVFNVGLEYFFNDERKRHVVSVVRKRDRQRFPERPGTPEISYFFESLDYPANSRKLSSYFAEFQGIAKERLKPHSHPGVELIYVLAGTLIVTIGSEPHSLCEGDSLYFDSSVPHTYWKADEATCSALIVTTA